MEVYVVNIYYWVIYNLYLHYKSIILYLSNKVANDSSSPTKNAD